MSNFKKDFSNDTAAFVPSGSNSNASNISIKSRPKKNELSDSKKSGSRKRLSKSTSKRNTNGESTSNSSRSNSNVNLNLGSNLLEDSNEILSAMKASRKGVNISHLIDFKFESDDSFMPSDKNVRPKANNSNRKKQKSPEIILSGLSYINANYKFILDPNGDYKAQLLDPNLPLDIHKIIRVIVKQHDYHCPICLGDDFVAPRMTKCGHIFCYPCILSMFENVKNDPKKTSIGNMHNPSIFCPLCSEVLKFSYILLPVLVDQVHENDKKIEINKDHIVNLMYRGNSKIYSQPISNFYNFKGFNGDIPWINENCTPLNYQQLSPYIGNSRLMLCDSNFINACYQKDIDELLTQKYLDGEVYGDDTSSFDTAISKIQKDMSLHASESADQETPLRNSIRRPTNLSTANITEVRLPSFQDGHYYYQCDVNSRIHYFLSPLDVLVVNSLFKIPNIKDIQSSKLIDNPAYNLPLYINLHVENINSDDIKVTPELVNKYPFLGNLPYGSEVGFLEVDWSKFDNSFIALTDEEMNKLNGGIRKGKYPSQIPDHLTKLLDTRSKTLKQKRATEERARVRGEIRRERETLEIFSSKDEKNGLTEEDEIIFASANQAWEEDQYTHIENVNGVPVLKGVSGLNSLSIEDDASLNDKSNFTMATSVWGTKVPVVLDPEEEALRNEENKLFDEMIRKAKTDAGKSKGKKGKKSKIYIPI